MSDVIKHIRVTLNIVQTADITLAMSLTDGNKKPTKIAIKCPLLLDWMKLKNFQGRMTPQRKWTSLFCSGSGSDFYGKSTLVWWWWSVVVYMSPSHFKHTGWGKEVSFQFAKKRTWFMWGIVMPIFKWSEQITIFWR